MPNSPSFISSQLRRIATAIDNSSNPSRALVARDLQRLILRLSSSISDINVSSSSSKNHFTVYTVFLPDFKDLCEENGCGDLANLNLEMKKALRLLGLDLISDDVFRSSGFRVQEMYHGAIKRFEEYCASAASERPDETTDIAFGLLNDATISVFQG
jgi:hypothetical protein